jgi:hypothetical protein
MSKDEYAKSRQSSDMRGGLGEIFIVDRGHPALTTSQILTLGELNLLGLL